MCICVHIYGVCVCVCIFMVCECVCTCASEFVDICNHGEGPQTHTNTWNGLCGHIFISQWPCHLFFVSTCIVNVYLSSCQVVSIGRHTKAGDRLPVWWAWVCVCAWFREGGLIIGEKILRNGKLPYMYKPVCTHPLIYAHITVPPSYTAVLEYLTIICLALLLA